MYTQRILILFFILHNTVSFSTRYYIRNIAYPEETSESTSTTEKQIFGPDLCPNKSLISINDIKYSIEDISLKLQIEEKLLNSYHRKAIEVRDQYLEAFEALRAKLADRPKHMLHILVEMNNKRQELEPIVRRIETQLQEFVILEEKYSDIAERSESQLIQLEKYKKLCQINCEDIIIDPRYGNDKFSNSSILHRYTENMFCVSLKELHESITKKLKDFQENYDKIILSEFAKRNEMYGRNLTDLIINLKKAAVKQFGMTMYDILSLQDDYFHFNQYLNNMDISTELHHIKENTAEIKLKMIGLKRDAEIYRQYCMNCNSKRRVKRDIVGFENNWETEGDSTNEEHFGYKSDILNELIEAKIDEIIKNIQCNFTDIFAELDEKFNDPELIDSYLMKLQPIKEKVERDIKREQEALDMLKDSVPQSLVEKILEVSQKSKEMILRLDTAKQFVDQFI